MEELIGKRVDLMDVTGWRHIGTLSGRDNSSGLLRWILDDSYLAFYTYEDGSNANDWVYKGKQFILDNTISIIGESLISESNIKEPMNRTPKS